MEEAKNWLDKLSEDRNLTEISIGAGRAVEKKVWHEGLCSSEGDTSLCWVCRYCGGQARYFAGVHSSVVELTSLAIHPFHSLRNLINPTVDWLG